MSSQFTTFDVATLELTKGTHLVEASAGTGKTFAIGMVVLRAVAELGIPIEKILVVTFTKAATEELRGRIRVRLVEALELLKNEEGATEIDSTLIAWGNHLADKDKKKAILLIQAALHNIDCASIYTIHSYCQKMLNEQALESNQLFEAELIADIDLFRSEVAHDFWRNHLYRQHPFAVAVIQQQFPTPEALLYSVSSVCTAKIEIDPAITKVGPIDAAIECMVENFTELQHWWVENGEYVRKQFKEAISEKLFNKKIAGDFEDWFATVQAFLSGETLHCPDEIVHLDKKIIEGQLSKAKLKSAAKRAEYLESWCLPDLLLGDSVTSREELLLALRVHLAHGLKYEVRRRLLSKGKMGFDDLIGNLARALREKGGDQLKHILSDRYKMALIDEFQDTDGDQYHIFKTLFGDRQHYLYLIGDPKQAIYKFRGADINSYFIAKKSASSLLTLDRNYRSHPFLVTEVNRLFASSKAPFLYTDEKLQFYPVSSAREDKDYKLVKEGDSRAGMVYSLLPPNPGSKDGRWSAGKAREHIRRFVVGEIEELLRPNSLDIVDKAETSSLMPADIAILVRKNSEAEEYRETLSLSGIPAVVTSRASVFHTNECRDLLRLLGGIASPTELSKVKSAMTVSWFGMSGTELYAIWEDETELSIWQKKMADYLALWRDQNFLTMMTNFIVKEGVFKTLAGGRQSERKIANILHLLELVQEQENNEKYGIREILAWLSRSYFEEKPEESGELLLDSDEQAVQIVTMHRAKGLEYPVVFCPVLWGRTDFLSLEKEQIQTHELDGKVIVDLGSEQFEKRKQKELQEQAAEELRLLYVALTRAKLRCYTVWADVKKHGMAIDAFDSALGYLLFPKGKCSSEEQSKLFATLRDRQTDPCIEIQEIFLESEEVKLSLSTNDSVLKPRLPSGRTLHTDWQVSSFSAMTAHLDSRPSYEDSIVLSDDSFIVSVKQGDVPAGANSSLIEVTGLPAGPRFGNVIHDLLEELSFSEVATEKELERFCMQKCRRYGFDTEFDKIADLLRITTSSKLPPGFALKDVPDNRCLKEMEFYFHMEHIGTEYINRLLAEERTVKPVSSRTMQGYLTGFVDLICEVDGQFFILDYKTNFLGEEIADYHPENLITAMREHNYGLQYWIYTMVLHNHLEKSLPTYSYDKHFGGVMYLFVRGMSLQYPGNGVFFDRPDRKTLRKLDCLIGGATSES